MFEVTYYRKSRRDILINTIRYTLSIMANDVYDFKENDELLKQRQRMHLGIIENMKIELLELKLKDNHFSIFQS
jgi:hypothetical protein|tara:strand:- start:247 stop:468 length:222 start_codon:yes stop_codon:yes gene_type:complete